jgi:hypothetical protein
MVFRVLGAAQHLKGVHAPSSADYGGALQTRERPSLWRSRISGAPLRKSFALHRIRE